MRTLFLLEAAVRFTGKCPALAAHLGYVVVEVHTYRARPNFP